MKAPSASSKQYIVLVLKPHLPSTLQTPSESGNLQDKKSGAFPEGHFILPKAKRALEDDYYTSTTSRKASGTINIKLPYHGAAAGVSYEVRGIDNKEFLCICIHKIKIDPVGLLEDANNAAYSKTVQQLLELKSKGHKYPPALDPLKGEEFLNSFIYFLGTHHTHIYTQMTE